MIKEDFPVEGSRYEGGISDGWQYQIKFSGRNLQSSLDMIKSFLEEEGYGALPIPETGADLLHFRFPAKHQQLQLFVDNGYIHNPIKILFDTGEARPKTLTLCIFNEKIPQHLLKFHGKIV